MKAFVSLWSADLLDLGTAIDALDPMVEGFHLDIMDGQFVPELLFGPDTVRAIAKRDVRALIDVHLMVGDADAWIEPFCDAGAQMLTIHPQSCRDLGHSLADIERRGVKPAIALTTDLEIEDGFPYLETVDRVLVMGTAIGIKGVDISEDVFPRIRALAAARDRSDRRPDIVVDGGIRRHTVPRLAQAGADGVVPGSLVFGQADWQIGVQFIHDQAATAEAAQ